MSNPKTEATGVLQVNDSPAGAQVAAAVDFNALQLHKDGAAGRAPAVVAEAQLTPAVYHPGESAHLQEVQYRERGREQSHIDFGFSFGIGPGFYDNFPPRGYRVPVVPEVCYPSPYYGAPPVCYANPGYDFGYRYRVPERHYYPEDRRYLERQHHEYPRGPYPYRYKEEQANKLLSASQILEPSWKAQLTKNPDFKMPQGDGRADRVPPQICPALSGPEDTAKQRDRLRLPSRAADSSLPAKHPTKFALWT